VPNIRPVAAADGTPRPVDSAAVQTTPNAGKRSIKASRLDHVPTSAPANSIRQPQDVEQLWKSRNFDKVLDVIDGEIAQLEQSDLSNLGTAGLEQWVETLYLRQHQLIGLANDADLRDRPGLPTRALTLLRRLGNIQTPMFEETVKLADAADKVSVQAWQVFCNTMKKPGYHSLSDTQKYFVEKLKKFVSLGGDFRDIKVVSPEVVKSLKNGDMCEWVVDKFDVARMSSSEAKVSPGHTLLGWGQDALAAGSMRIFKDAQGGVQQVIIGTFSGHYRSSAEYSVKLVRHLVAAGVDPEKIIIQGGEAGTPRALELLYRALGRDGAELQKALATIEAKAAHFNPVASAPEEKAAPKPKGEAAEAIWRQTVQLNEACVRMNQTLLQVLSDGVILASPAKREELTAAITGVLARAETAGNRAAYDNAIATLRHVATLEDPRLDPIARKELAALYETSTKHTFGAGAVDIANIFGPPPPTGRRTRVLAMVDHKLTPGEIRKLIDAGLDTARVVGKVGHAKDLAEVIAAIRAAEVGGRRLNIMIDLPDVAPAAGKNRFDAYEKMLKPVLADIDLVSLPQVTDLSDVLTLRGLMIPQGKVVPIVAVIDTKAGADNIERIAQAADGMVLDRAKLAAAIGAEVVPSVARRMHSLGNNLGRATVATTGIGEVAARGFSRRADSQIDAIYDSILEHAIEAVTVTPSPRSADAFADAIRMVTRVADRAENDCRDQLYRELAASSVDALGKVPTSGA
jgi:hypothetical protein